MWGSRKRGLNAAASTGSQQRCQGPYHNRHSRVASPHIERSGALQRRSRRCVHLPAHCTDRVLQRHDPRQPIDSTSPRSNVDRVDSDHAALAIDGGEREFEQDVRLANRLLVETLGLVELEVARRRTLRRRAGC